VKRGKGAGESVVIDQEKEKVISSKEEALGKIEVKG